MKIVILAGGKGTRLWPLSRPNFPKQFLSFGEGISLLQKTILRFVEVYGKSSILVVTCKDSEHLVKAHIDEIDQTGDIAILVEPSSKSTAPALFLAVRFLEETKRLKRDECVLAAPSDSFFSSESDFLEALSWAEKGAQKGFFSLLGKIPHRPETGYGYLRLGEKIGQGFFVEEFIEKPGLEQAQSLMDSKEVFWNLGHLVFQPKVFWKQMELYLPGLFALKELTWSKCLEKIEEILPISIEQGMLEKSRHLMAYPVKTSWSDIGSWDNIYELLNKDQRGNVKRGNVSEKECKNSLFLSEKRPIIAIGVEDVFLIETKEAVLLLKKGESQKVKEFAEKRVSSKEEPYEIERGQLRFLEKKEIPLDKLSHRLIVLKGELKVTLQEEVFFLHENETIYIPFGSAAAIENEGFEPVEFLRVQTGGVKALC